MYVRSTHVRTYVLTYVRAYVRPHVRTYVLAVVEEEEVVFNGCRPAADLLLDRANFLHACVPACQRACVSASVSACLCACLFAGLPAQPTIEGEDFYFLLKHGACQPLDLLLLDRLFCKSFIA